MKRIALLNIIIVVFIFGCSSNNKKEQVGLLSHFPFTGNAKDVINKNSNVIIKDAKLTTDRFGNSNSAYSFNGVTSSISVSVKNFPKYQKQKSISWWYFTEELPKYNKKYGAQNMIVLVDTLNGTGIQFGFRAPEYKTLGLDTWIWGGGNVLDVIPPKAGVWHYCVYTYDREIHKFYLDGKEVASSKVTLQDGMPTQLMFGNYPTGKQYFTGKLDDIRIYNNALDFNSINTLFKEVQN